MSLTDASIQKAPGPLQVRSRSRQGVINQLKCLLHTFVANLQEIKSLFVVSAFLPEPLTGQRGGGNWSTNPAKMYSSASLGTAEAVEPVEC